MFLSVIRDTFLKLQPLQASTLPADQKSFQAKGVCYVISAYKIEADHIKFTLGIVRGQQQTIAGHNTWYAYLPHVQVANDRGIPIDLTPSELPADALDLIKSFEGCRLSAYDDGTGVWTVGVGHTGSDVFPGLAITQQRADQLLQQDLQSFEVGVQKMVKVALNPNQFGAIVSFAFNCGLESLDESTLLADLNAGNYSAAADQFLLWDRADGQELPGLLRRRKAERALFLGQDWRAF